VKDEGYKEIDRRFLHHSVPIIRWCPHCEAAWRLGHHVCPACKRKLETRAALLVKE